MIYPAPDKLDNVGSKYALVIVAAKRAKQLRDGARRLVESKSTNPLTVALEELAEGKITMLQVGEPEPLPSGPAPTPVLGGLLSTYLDDDLAADDAKADDLLPLGDDSDDLEVVAADDEEDEGDLAVAVLGDEEAEDEDAAPAATVPILDDADEEGIAPVVAPADDDEETETLAAVADVVAGALDDEADGEDEDDLAMGVADADDAALPEADEE